MYTWNGGSPLDIEVSRKHNQAIHAMRRTVWYNDTSWMPKSYLSKTDEKAYQEVVGIEL
jgi:hypothetical protein